MNTCASQYKFIVVNGQTSTSAFHKVMCQQKMRWAKLYPFTLSFFMMLLANKKSELMLMKCTRAYGSSCSQLISVYIYRYPFRHTSLFCSQKSYKITKILYFQGRARSLMLIPLISTSPLLVMII